jgi:SAM-dependent methyltransferase
MDHSSRSRLSTRDLQRFANTSLFDKIARAVCRAGCLPRKELFESWEVARRVRRRFRGSRVVDMACGHGLLSYILLLLDDTSPEAVAIDHSIPPSAAKLAKSLEAEWPRLNNRVHFIKTDLGNVELSRNDLIVSSHACGELTDLILERAATVGARIAVLPCCHDLKTADQGGLEGWMDGPLAVDATRVANLKAQGYKIYTRQIPKEITPMNRLLMAEKDDLAG